LDKRTNVKAQNPAVCADPPLLLCR